MEHTTDQMKKQGGEGHGTLGGYVAGFVLSLAATIGAYLLVQAHVSSEHSIISHPVLIGGVLAFAFFQALIQLYFFLHLGKKGAPLENLLMLLTTASLIFIVVGASIWIMYNLNYRMTTDQINQYLEDQGSF